MFLWTTQLCKHKHNYDVIHDIIQNNTKVAKLQAQCTYNSGPAELSLLTAPLQWYESFGLHVSPKLDAGYCQSWPKGFIKGFTNGHEHLSNRPQMYSWCAGKSGKVILRKALCTALRVKVLYECTWFTISDWLSSGKAPITLSHSFLFVWFILKSFSHDKAPCRCGRGYKIYKNKR